MWAMLTATAVQAADAAGACRCTAACGEQAERPPHPPIECGKVGSDGAQWIVEARDRAGCHLIIRWSPENGPVRDARLAMLALTGRQFGEVY